MLELQGQLESRYEHTRQPVLFTTSLKMHSPGEDGPLCTHVIYKKERAKEGDGGSITKTQHHENKG